MFISEYLITRERHFFLSLPIVGLFVVEKSDKVYTMLLLALFHKCVACIFVPTIVNSHSLNNKIREQTTVQFEVTYIMRNRKQDIHLRSVHYKLCTWW